MVLEKPPEPVLLAKPASINSKASEQQQQPSPTGASAAAMECDGGNSSSSSTGRKRERQLPCVESDDGGEDWEVERLKHRAALQEKWNKAAAAKAATDAQVGASTVCVRTMSMYLYGNGCVLGCCY